MLSSQIGSLSDKVDYNSLNKVYSIWICFDVPEHGANTISRYRFMKEDIFGDFEIQESDYGMMETIIIRLSKNDSIIGNEFIDVLHSLFGVLDYEEKMNRLKSLNLVPTDNVKMEVKNMCNLSEMVFEKGVTMGIEKERADIIINMYKKKFTMEQIANAINMDINGVREILQAQKVMQ